MQRAYRHSSFPRIFYIMCLFCPFRAVVNGELMVCRFSFQPKTPPIDKHSTSREEDFISETTCWGHRTVWLHHWTWFRISHIATASYMSCDILPKLVFNNLRWTENVNFLIYFLNKKKLIKPAWTYLPGQTDGSQALPALWRTLPAGRCAHTCTQPCLWSAAAPASSGTGSCSGRLSEASLHCSQQTEEELKTWFQLWE